MKLLAWVQFHRFGYPLLQQIEIVLPRRVATKYVTVSFLNCENYLADAGDSTH